MRNGSIAKRYARALLKIGAEQSKVEELYEELNKLQTQLVQYPPLQILLASPVVKSSQKKAVLKEVNQRLGMSPTIGALMYLLIDQQRVSVLPILVMLYRDMADELLGRVRVRVKSVADLGPSTEKLKVILAKVLGKKILLECEIDPQILGGLVIQVNDQVFDASLKSELERMREDIVNKAVA